MIAVVLAFVAVALAMLAGRESVRVARLARGGVALVPLLAVIAAVSALASGVAAWLAGTFAGIFPPQHQHWLVAAALLLAALEVLLLGEPDVPAEPTQSLGAIGLVLFAGIVTDASGMLVLSLALATGAPALAATGAALALIGVLGMAAFAAGDWEALPRRPLRWTVGGALLIAAGVIALVPPMAFD